MEHRGACAEVQGLRLLDALRGRGKRASSPNGRPIERAIYNPTAYLRRRASSTDLGALT
jgi:hypothetical protein